MLAISIYLLTSGCFWCGFVMFGLTDPDPVISDVPAGWRLFGASVAAFLWPLWLCFALPIGFVLLLGACKRKCTNP